MAKVYGDKQTLAALDKKFKQYPNAAVAAVYQEAIEIFNESQEQVPVDTGNLRQSGMVFVLEQGADVNVMISYAAKYALAIHERTELDANRVAPGETPVDGKTTGKSKYLQDPFQEAQAGLEARISRRMDLMLASVGRAPDPAELPKITGSKGG